MGRTTSPTCIEPGCNQPKYVSETGRKHARCHEHQKLFWAASARAREAAMRGLPAPTPGRAKSAAPAPAPTRHAVSESASHVGHSPQTEPPPSDPHSPRMERGTGGEVGCTCPDCVFREAISLIAARNPRIAELVDVLQAARRLRDDLGI